MSNNISWVFFGTPYFSTLILDKMKEAGFVPNLIVTVPDKPKGRKLVLTPPETKVWAEKENIPYLQLKSLKGDEVIDQIKSSSPKGFDVFVVASYGKIIPQSILDIPTYKTINVHPSLLPKLRGPSPIVSAILDENETGVTIMRLDAEMDHGPILSQKKVDIEWPPYAKDLEYLLGEVGGQMLAEIMPKWVAGDIKEIPQDHEMATFCVKINKEDGEINLSDSPEINLRKIRAYHEWPGAYFFDKRKDTQVRIIIKKAHIENGVLVIDSVVPEGKKEMSYASYLNGKKS